MATMSASLNTAPAWVAPSAPALDPSSPTPATTPVTATHSRQDSATLITSEAKTAVTARFDATIAWTANSGSRCRAMSCATNPRASRHKLTTNRHCRSMRGSRPGSTPPASASSGLRLLASCAATDCITDAIP